MSKKKYNKNNNEIIESMLTNCIPKNNDLLIDIDNLKRSLTKIVDSNLGHNIKNSEYIGSAYTYTYRVASKFIQKYNKKIKNNRRSPLLFEFGDPNTMLANYDNELRKITKYYLEDGIYSSQLDNKTYCVLILKTEEYNIHTNLYFIGKKWKKWKSKFEKELKYYNELSLKSSFEYIYEINNQSGINTIFKSFDNLIFSKKEKTLKYIDNWLKNIPIYYNKYNMIPKLSILIHGSPGTGKSTFCKALAKYLGIQSITKITSNYFHNDSKNYNSEYEYYGNNLTRKTIYVIDDIDCICKSRLIDNSNDNNTILSNLLSFLDNPPTFNYIADDGISYPISIIVATTNYYDKLDEAVKRYGRFDLNLEMNYFNKKEAQEMCDIYDLKLEDIVKKSDKKDFKISPSKLQALCLDNIDKSLKSINSFEYRDNRVLIHRIKR